MKEYSDFAAAYNFDSNMYFVVFRADVSLKNILVLEFSRIKYVPSLCKFG